LSSIKIRNIRNEEISTVVELWYETSIKAHDFISKEYWKDNKAEMQEKYIPNSETYVAELDKKIAGFISLMDDYLAAIFVKQEEQGKKIGTTLLNYVKTSKEKLQLKVYSKNTKSIEFYKTNGFSVQSESIDENTGEKELLMEWVK
jgi:putative acetyltransferase